MIGKVAGYNPIFNEECEKTFTTLDCMREIIVGYKDSSPGPLFRSNDDELRSLVELIYNKHISTIIQKSEGDLFPYEDPKRLRGISERLLEIAGKVKWNQIQGQ